VHSIHPMRMTWRPSGCILPVARGDGPSNASTEFGQAGFHNLEAFLLAELRQNRFTAMQAADQSSSHPPARSLI
jgi:hypothetical protein